MHLIVGKCERIIALFLLRDGRRIAGTAQFFDLMGRVACSANAFRLLIRESQWLNENWN